MKSRTRWIWSLVVWTLAAFTAPGFAQDVVEPESVGLSSEQLANIDRLINHYMADNTIPGAVVLVARHGQIAYLKAFGKADEGRPLETDAIFRLASLSKPIVGPTGILQLMDQGKVVLSAPASRYIPEFQGQPVAQVDDQGEITFVPAAREVTIHDLLTFTAGFPGPWDTGPLARMYDEVFPRSARWQTTIQERATLAAQMPLANQPGTIWGYSDFQLDVIGAIVERISSMRIDRYYADHLFAPLGMADTAFYPPEAAWPRVTGLYYAKDGEAGHKGDVYRDDESASTVINLRDYSFDPDPVYFMLYGGLHSTAYDVFRFFQMLLNGGELDGVRVLSQHAVEMMLHNQIGDQRESQYGHGWGYAIGVQVEPSPRPIIGKTYGGTGAFSWDGYTGPSAFGNPRNDTVIVIMTHIWDVSQIWDLQAGIVNIVNRAIED